MLNSQTLTLCLLTTASVLLLTNCKKEAEIQDYSFEEYFSLSIENKDFFAQIAITQEELSQGLMFRNNLDENHGMLFAFDHPQRMSFWMKNVSIPLDIGYFDSNGRLMEIHSLHPYDEKSIFSKSQNIQYALEMNQGWYNRNEIKTGSYINVEKVLGYIKLRKNTLNYRD